MSIFDPSPSPWTDRMRSVLRIVSALLFITAGTTKVFHWPVGPMQMPPFDPMSQAGIAGLLEVVGGTLLAIGLFTRPTAFVLAGLMAAAYFIGHFPQSFWPTINQGMPAILFCFIYLYLMLAGPGPWSVDAVLARRRRRATVGG